MLRVSGEGRSAHVNIWQVPFPELHQMKSLFACGWKRPSST
jgi:hypothetical protein